MYSKDTHERLGVSKKAGGKPGEHSVPEAWRRKGFKEKVAIKLDKDAELVIGFGKI